MEQQRVASTDMMKKITRPKSSILSRILNGNSLTSVTRTVDSSTTKNCLDNDKCNNYNGSNKLEILNREQYLMTTSFSTPTAKISTYAQLRSEYDTLTQAPSPEICLESNDEDNINQEIKIPNRRQSNLYTPFHDRNEFTATNPATTLNTDYYHSKRRSYYLAPPVDTTMSNNASSLSRSATWQPSSSLAANNNTTTTLYDTPTGGGASSNHQIINTDIPARRTSRNYTNNPEIQAKLDAMLRSDKALFLSKTLAHNKNDESNQLLDTNSNVRRRSTTPGHY